MESAGPLNIRFFRLCCVAWANEREIKREESVRLNGGNDCESSRSEVGDLAGTLTHFDYLAACRGETNSIHGTSRAVCLLPPRRLRSLLKSVMNWEQIARSRTLPAADIFRARLILMLAEGLPYRTMQTRLDTTAATISRWKQRFVKGRIAGLTEVRHPGKRPFVITPALTAKVLSATRRQPQDGSTHWSCRKLAQSLGISKDSVQRIWQKAEWKPHRLQRSMASDDPDFERNAAIEVLEWLGY
jgi:transposase